MKWCVVNVTFGEPYDEFQPRLLASLDKYWGGPRMIWTGELPKGSPSHVECPFGFKLHAIKAAYDAGYEGVIWLDGGGYLTGPIDRLIEQTTKDGYYFVYNPIEPLSRWVSDEALKGLGTTRQQVADYGWKLFAGTPYALSLTNAITSSFWVRWWSAMERGLFKHVAGDSSTDFYGHRHDEAVAAVIAYQLGMKPSEFGGFYVGDEKDTPTSFIRSGHAH